MTTNAADCPAFPLRTTSAKDERHFRLKAVLTAAGAVSTVTSTDPLLSIAKNGGTTGQYDLTYPASPGDVLITPVVYSPAGTISQAYIKTKSFTAGTASLIFSAPNGTAAYGASGDEIYIDLWIDLTP